MANYVPGIGFIGYELGAEAPVQIPPGKGEKVPQEMLVQVVETKLMEQKPYRDAYGLWKVLKARAAGLRGMEQVLISALASGKNNAQIETLTAQKNAVTGLLDEIAKEVAKLQTESGGLSDLYVKTFIESKKLLSEKGYDVSELFEVGPKFLSEGLGFLLVPFVILVVAAVVVSFSPLIDLLRDMVVFISGYDARRAEVLKKFYNEREQFAKSMGMSPQETIAYVASCTKSLPEIAPSPKPASWIPWVAVAVLGVVIAPQLPAMFSRGGK